MFPARFNRKVNRVATSDVAATAYERLPPHVAANQSFDDN